VQFEIKMEETINQAKELISKLLPDKNMKIVFDIPGGSDKSDILINKIKVKVTETY
jgi:hypothetical protein